MVTRYLWRTLPVKRVLQIPGTTVSPYQLAEVLRALGIAALVLTPFVFIGIFYRYGREKPFTVPKYLSFVPDPAKKPWVVNLLFKGDAMTFDEDGYYATLIDLHRRGIIRITEKEGDKGCYHCTAGKGTG